MTSSSRQRTVLALPLLLAPLLLTACSPAGALPKATATAPVQAAPTSASAAPSASAAVTGPSTTGMTGTQLCALVSTADAQAAEQAKPAFRLQSGITGSYDDPECDYSSSAASGSVDVLLYPSREVSASATSSYLNQVAATPIAGLGNKASGSAYEVDVDLGASTLIVYVPTELGTPAAGLATTAGLTALAKLFVAKLS